MMALADVLYSQGWLPLWHRFTGLFDLNGRLGVVFLAISLVVAYLQYRRRNDGHYRHFGHFLGGRRVWLHRSAIIDYQYYFLRVLLHAALIVPLLNWLDPYLLHSGEVSSTLAQWWGGACLAR